MLDEKDKATALAGEVLKTDKLDLFARVELSGFNDSKNEIHMFEAKPENFIDIAVSYINAGFYGDAVHALELSNNNYPLYDYYKAYCFKMLGESAKALEYAKAAESRDECYCFPSRLDDIAVLENAIAINKTGAKA